jgi:hypothetical protein
VLYFQQGQNKENVMKAVLTLAAGLIMVGAVAANPLQAQRPGSQGSERGRPAANPRAPVAPAPAHNRAPAHSNAPRYITVTERVWIPGHYTTVTERVLVPGRYETRIEQVWVPARNETTRERRVDARGRVYYSNVTRTIPGHYEEVECHVYVPAHHREVQRQVWVHGRYELQQRQVRVDCGIDQRPSHRHRHRHRHTRR